MRGYAAVLALPGLRRLVGGQALARIAQQMASVALVLYVLERFGSPPLAGIVLFLSIAPGLLVSPFAGALLDRHGRVRLITVDYVIAAISLGLIVILGAVGLLPAAVLCVLVALASLTNPLSNSGTRSLFPVVVPRHLWDRANALDSGGYLVAAIVGPALAGVLAGLIRPAAALGATAAFDLAAALVVAGVALVPGPPAQSRGLVGDARDGVAFLLRSRSLRSLAITLSTFNLGFGIVTVALPVLVLRDLGGGSGEVGVLFAVLGGGGIVGGLIAGGIDSEGRERHHMVVGFAIAAIGLALMIPGSHLALVVIGMALLGAGNGPVDIGLFALRQRRTPVAWTGRVFAVSMAFNFSGTPIGAGIGGALADHSTAACFAIAALLAAVSAALSWWAIPARAEAPPQVGAGRARAAH